MATYALIHGAGDGGWFWHLVAAELRGRGQEVVAPDLPTEDDAAGLPEYAEAVVEAVGDRGDLIVVAQSFGGFTAPPGLRPGAGRPAGAAGRDGPIAGLAGGPDPLPTLPRRPLLPARVPAPGGPGAPRHRPGRDRRQPLRRPQPTRELADRLEGYRAAL
jgi:alpha-beta hydrolase superfamily lysophospholipase